MSTNQHNLEITPDPQNPNRHNKRSKQAVRDSLEAYGAGRSVVVDNSGSLIAGNSTYEQAADLGLETEQVHTNGDELVVVVREDLESGDPKTRGLHLADNKVAELSKLDEDTVAEALSKFSDEDAIYAAGYSDAEVDALIQKARKIPTTTTVTAKTDSTPATSSSFTIRVCGITQSAKDRVLEKVRKAIAESDYTADAY